MKSGRESLEEFWPSGVKTVSSNGYRVFLVMSNGNLWGVGRGINGEFGTGFGDLDELTELISMDFASWLRGYFSPDQIQSWGETARIRDPDSDGISNEKEMSLGLDPATAMTLYAKASVIDHRSVVEVSSDYIEGFEYSIWRTDDLVDWEEFEPPIFYGNGKLYFDVSESESPLYRVRLNLK